MGATFATITVPQEGIERMTRPNLLSSLTAGRVAVVVNFATPDTLAVLRMTQIGGVPCNNPHCKGGESGWNTVPVAWRTDTTAPLTFIDMDGSRAC